tara:strand:+ start:53 stop:361 length:309 start_codon:yes stop_codon:yes gene_type:complete
VTRNNYKKIDLSNFLREKKGYSSLFSQKIVDDLIYVISKNLVKGDITLKNLGVFKIIQKSERLGRNPRTKKTYIINKRKSLSFTCSKSFLKTVNKDGKTNIN